MRIHISYFIITSIKLIMFILLLTGLGFILLYKTAPYFKDFVETTISHYLIRDVESFHNDSHKYINVNKIEFLEKGNHFFDISEKDKFHFSNWLNYIYHINDTKPESECTLDFNELDVMLIHYTYNNKEYTIHMDKDFNDSHTRSNIEHSIFKKNIINAVISKTDNTHNLDISDHLKKFIGPNSDFYKSLTDSDITQNLNHILHHLDLDYWDKIHITDTHGNYIEIDLKETKILNWNNKITL